MVWSANTQLAIFYIKNALTLLYHKFYKMSRANEAVFFYYNINFNKCQMLLMAAAFKSLPFYYNINFYKCQEEDTATITEIFDEHNSIKYIRKVTSD